jgi:hypothetical protein
MRSGRKSLISYDLGQSKLYSYFSPFFTNVTNNDMKLIESFFSGISISLRFEDFTNSIKNLNFCWPFQLRIFLCHVLKLRKRNITFQTCVSPQRDNQMKVSCRLPGQTTLCWLCTDCIVPKGRWLPKYISLYSVCR